VETSEQYMAIARRWFTEGWTGNLAMADDIFSAELRTNGVHVGVAGPVGGPYGGVPPTGKPVEVRDTAIWHVQHGKVTEILTLQDQFAILKQIGYLPESVHAA
jgi:hypothetical protein